MKAGTFQAPGRVNLIGEHTDYNDGYVLPLALSGLEVALTARRRDDYLVRLRSAQFGDQGEFALAGLQPTKQAGWIDYVKGVAWALQEAGYRPVGFEGEIARSALPIGAGLSSSAAIEVAAARAMRGLSGLKLDDVQLALLCQKAENEFVGMKCGIMDQFAASVGRPGRALLLDTRTLKFELVDLPPDAAVVIIDTGVRRKLTSSAYNQRRSECEEAVRLLAPRLGNIQALRDVSPEQLQRHLDALPSPALERARHIVGENQRVLDMVAALRRGDLAAAGELMNQSHYSLRDDYAVSCPELDVLSELARKYPGCYGSRMTGAGFGGCTVSLVDRASAREFGQVVVAQYRAQTGQEGRLVQ